MFSTNKGNNKNDKKTYDVNTKGIQFKNREGIDSSTLLIDFWKEAVTLKIHPALPVEKQTTESVYDYEHSLSTALVLPKVQSILSLIPNFRKAMEEEKNYSIGVKIGTSCIVMLSTGVKETGMVRPFLGIYKDIDADTLIPNQGIRYEFAENEVMENYDPNEGNKESEIAVRSEFELFIAVLESARDALTNAYTHSMRNVENFHKNRQNEILTNIANKVGAEVPTYGYKKAFGENNNQSFRITPQQAGPSDMYSSLPDAPISEVNINEDFPW